MSFFLQTLSFPSSFSKFFEFKREYMTQYSKNHNLLKTNYKTHAQASLDFESFTNVCHSIFFLEPNIFRDFCESSDKFIYLIVGLLSIYEIDKNISHFEFVLFSNPFISNILKER